MSLGIPIFDPHHNEQQQPQITSSSRTMQAPAAVLSPITAGPPLSLPMPTPGSDTFGTNPPALSFGAGTSVASGPGSMAGMVVPWLLGPSQTGGAGIFDVSAFSQLGGAAPGVTAAGMLALSGSTSHLGLACSSDELLAAGLADGSHDLLAQLSRAAALTHLASAPLHPGPGSVTQPGFGQGHLRQFAFTSGGGGVGGNALPSQRPAVHPRVGQSLARMSSSPRVSGSSLSSPSTVSALIPAKPRVIVRTLFSQDMPLAAPTSTQPHGATFNSSGAMLEHVDQLAKAAGMMPASIPSSSDASDSCAGLPGSHVLDFIEQQNPQLWDALRYQGDLDMSTLFNVVVDHLRAPTQEFTVVLVHPKVVQKSYGKEKRFFCPQPILYLVGSSWPRLFASHSARERSLRPTASVSFIDPEQPPPRASRKRQRRISGSRGRSSVEADGGNSDGSEIPDATPGSAGGSLNSRSGVWGTVEIEPRRVNLLSRTSSFGRCSPFARTAVCNSLSASFKGLYVSDSDKRKSFHLYFQINESTSSTFICCLQSKEIKVISKPSRNKSIAKSTDLTISSGDYIALFNRVRSQTVSTRYMTVSPDGMRLSSSHSPWDTFVIWLHDDPMFRARQRATKGARPSEPWRLQHLAPEPPSMDGVTEVEVQAGESSLGRSDQTQGSSGGRFDDDSSVSERTLHYGDVVILENLMTGLLTVPLILRRVDGKCLAVIEDRGSSKQGADGAPSMDASDQAAAAAATMLSIKAGDPPTKDAVSQLHKIAFQLQSQSGQYISLRDESVVVYDATNEAGVSRKQLRQDASTHADDDGEEAGDADARNRKGSFSSAGTQESATNAAAATKRSRSGSAGSRARSGGASSTPIVAEDVTEQSVWSIVGTDLVEHTFHVPVVSAALDQAGRGAHESPTALGGAPTVQQAAQSSEAGETMRQRPRSKTAAAQAAPVLQINPMPTVEALQQEAPTVLLCRGSEFGPNLWAYAGVVPAIKVVLRTSDTILVEFPCAVSVLPRPDGASEPSSPGGDSVVSDAPFGAGPEEAAHRGQGPSREGGGLEAVPLLLVRDDGVLFRTGFTVAVHEPESAVCL